MYDILFINPPLVDYDKEKIPKFFLKTSLFPPIGIAYLSSYLEKYNFKTWIIDMDAEKYSLSKLDLILRLLDPKIIGITMISDSTFNISSQIVKKIKMIRDIPIIVGGFFATNNSVFLMNRTNIDYIIRGEGEVTTLELLNCLKSKKGTLNQINGLTFRQNGTIITNPDRELIQNLDDLPFPVWNKFPICKYFISVAYKNPSFAVLAARGCPYKCIFCSTSVFHNYRNRSPKNVVDEIEFLKNNYNIKDITFHDPTFNINPNWVIELCKELLRRKLKIKWRCLCRPDRISERMLSYMKASGCYYISFGIESSKDKFLEFLQKDFTIEEVRKAIKLSKKYNIEIMANFMYGIPGQTISDLEHNISFIKEINPDYINVVILTPFTGSKLYEYAQKNRMLLNTDIEYLKNPEKIGLQRLIWKIPNLNEKILNFYIKKTYFLYFFRFKTICKYFIRYLKKPSRLLYAIKNTIIRFL